MTTIARRGSVLVAAGVLGIAAALIAVGFPAAFVGLVTLAPLVAHVRHVGLRYAITEPTPIVPILGFYLLFFPLRGLVVALSGNTDLAYMHQAITNGDLTSLLLLASVAMTTLVEAYYLARRWHPPATRSTAARPMAERRAMVRLASLLWGISYVALLLIFRQHGGISATRAAFISHSVDLSVQDTGAGSGWQLFAIPAVWCSSYVLLNRCTERKVTKWGLAGATVLFFAVQLYIYGSRLNTLLALLGVWIVAYHAGYRLPGKAVVATLAVGVIASQLIVSERQDTYTQHLSAVERYSELAGYGVLDIALEVQKHPDFIRTELERSSRWLNIPAYFVPSILWPGRPNIGKVALGLYTAQQVGTVNDRNTGFPTTYIIESWLLGGWVGTLLWSVGFGALLGLAIRQLSRPSPSAITVLSYCFVVTVAWDYFKDGDILETVVGQTRLAVYLLALCWVTGVISTRSVSGGDFVRRALKRPATG